MICKYKNDRWNVDLEKLYIKKTKRLWKTTKESKEIYENIQNETVANEEAMAKKLKPHDYIVTKSDYS